MTVHVTSGTSEAPPPPVDPPPSDLPPAENQAPLAVNDVFTTPADTTLNVPAASGLLANDSDPDGNALIASLFSNPLHGFVSLAADGSFSYTPESGYSGLDAFLYRVSDGALWSSLAAVTIHVTASQGPDEAPLPTPDPEPSPEPCDHHHNSNVGENLLQALVSGPHQHHHASAVDAVFSRLRGWLS
jgi:hypothetical protein